MDALAIASLDPCALSCCERDERDSRRSAQLKAELLRADPSTKAVRMRMEQTHCLPGYGAAVASVASRGASSADNTSGDAELELTDDEDGEALDFMDVSLPEIVGACHPPFRLGRARRPALPSVTDAELARLRHARIHEMKAASRKSAEQREAGHGSCREVRLSSQALPCREWHPLGAARVTPIFHLPPSVGRRARAPGRSRGFRVSCRAPGAGGA